MEADLGQLGSMDPYRGPSATVHACIGPLWMASDRIGRGLVRRLTYVEAPLYW